MDCNRKNFFERSLCKFEGRYDEESKINPDIVKTLEVAISIGDISIPSDNKKTYVRDVCIRCGSTIERAK